MIRATATALVGALALALVLPATVAAAAPVVAPVAGAEVQYIIAPHQDDEWQDWSQIENSDAFTVYIVMSRGEQTAFCPGYSIGLQAPKGEIAATPTPGGRFTASCEDARLSSWRNFFTKMAVTDDTLPGTVTDFGKTRQFPSNGVNICRNDVLDGSTPCTISDKSAQVWKDSAGRGVLISFNLGEGDQTSAEVDWAIDTVLANKAEFQIDPTAPTRGIMGGYWNGSYPGCAVYNNVDHRAVHVALRNNRYPVPYQGAATCASDPDANLHVQVSEEAMKEAFEVTAAGQRVGAHTTNYGWLHETFYALSPHDQSSLFMGSQSFWVIHNINACN